MKAMRWLVTLALICLVANPGLAAPAYGKGNEKPLPPGLAMKQARGGELPPGWQKKLAKGDVLDDEIYSAGKVVVPVGKDGSITIEVDGTRLRVNVETRTILDIFD